MPIVGNILAGRLLFGFFLSWSCGSSACIESDCCNSVRDILDVFVFISTEKEADEVRKTLGLLFQCTLSILDGCSILTNLAP